MLERQHHDPPAVLIGRQRRLERGPGGLPGRYPDLTVRRVRGQVLAERNGEVWPGFDEEVIFELGIERCLLMLTQAEGAFPTGLTIWKARDAWGTAGSDMVT